MDIALGIAAILGSSIVGLCCFFEDYPKAMTWRVVAAVALVTVFGLLQLTSSSFGIASQAVGNGVMLMLIAIIGLWAISLFVFPAPMLNGDTRVPPRVKWRIAGALMSAYLTISAMIGSHYMFKGNRGTFQVFILSVGVISLYLTRDRFDRRLVAVAVFAFISVLVGETEFIHWVDTSWKDSINSYTRFLARFPNGSFKTRAEARLAEMRDNSSFLQALASSLPSKSLGRTIALSLCELPPNRSSRVSISIAANDAGATQARLARTCERNIKESLERFGNAFQIETVYSPLASDHLAFHINYSARSSGEYELRTVSPSLDIPLTQLATMGCG